MFTIGNRFRRNANCSAAKRRHLKLFLGGGGGGNGNGILYLIPKYYMQYKHDIRVHFLTDRGKRSPPSAVLSQMVAHVKRLFSSPKRKTRRKILVSSRGFVGLPTPRNAFINNIIRHRELSSVSTCYFAVLHQRATNRRRP